MTNYRTEMLDRLVAMEAEALDTYVATLPHAGTGVDAKPLLFYQQEDFPYIVHRVGPSIVDEFLETEDDNVRRYDVFIRVVIGHLTAGYEGEYEEYNNEIIPLLEDYFYKNPMLTTDSNPLYTTEPTWIYPTGLIVGDTSGVIPFELGGIDAVQIGEELSLEVPVLRFIDP